jgi:hypothetical protein
MELAVSSADRGLRQKKTLYNFCATGRISSTLNLPERSKTKIPDHNGP